MRSNLFWLSDAQWDRIAPLLPTDVRGKERVDDRRIITASPCGVSLPQRSMALAEQLKEFPQAGHDADVSGVRRSFLG